MCILFGAVCFLETGDLQHSKGAIFSPSYRSEMGGQWPREVRPEA